MLDQIIQISGSVMILAAFLALQLRKTTIKSLPYLLLNLVGSIVLTINAYMNHAWGFMLLEVVWAFVSVIGILRRHVSSSPVRDEPTTVS